MIEITRIYSDNNGKSHFEEIEMPLNNQGEIGFLSYKTPVKDIIFRKVKPDYDYDFHHAPQKQFILLCSNNIKH